MCITLLLHSAHLAPAKHHIPTQTNALLVHCAFLLSPGHCRDCEKVYLLKRKGFVKVALQAGTPIVPTYLLGQSQVRAAGWNERHTD